MYTCYCTIVQCSSLIEPACYEFEYTLEYKQISGFVVNGINNVNTTSVERRFGLPSSHVSLISSAYDISAGIFVIPVSYYGAFAHQPRMLSLAAVVMSLGSFVMTIPHFTTGLYELGDTMADQCDVYGKYI